MTIDPYEAERLRQAAAEWPAGLVEEGAVARHRYVLHAIRQLPVPQPPPDFARQVEACLRDYDEDARAEQWLLMVAAVAALVLVVATLGPWLAVSMASLAAASGDLPWRLLMVVATGLVGFAAFDHLRQTRRSR